MLAAGVALRSRSTSSTLSVFLQKLPPSAHRESHRKYPLRVVASKPLSAQWGKQRSHLCPLPQMVYASTPRLQTNVRYHVLRRVPMMSKATQVTVGTAWITVVTGCGARYSSPTTRERIQDHAPVGVTTLRAHSFAKSIRFWTSAVNHHSRPKNRAPATTENLWTVKSNPQPSVFETAASASLRHLGTRRLVERPRCGFRQ